VKRVYLDIGVEYGKAFRRVIADEKIAVDPAFKLSARSRRLADVKARATHYFETTSDAFFANETAFLEQHGIDVALIDGHRHASLSATESHTIEGITMSNPRYKRSTRSTRDCPLEFLHH
jgi:hypothetical protein